MFHHPSSVYLQSVLVILVAPTLVMKGNEVWFDTLWYKGVVWLHVARGNLMEKDTIFEMAGRFFGHLQSVSSVWCNAFESIGRQRRGTTEASLTCQQRRRLRRIFIGFLLQLVEMNGVMVLVHYDDATFCTCVRVSNGGEWRGRRKKF